MADHGFIWIKQKLLGVCVYVCVRKYKQQYIMSDVCGVRDKKRIFPRTQHTARDETMTAA